MTHEPGRVFGLGEVSEVNFVNVLRAAFTCTDPKSPKKTDDLTVFFALLVSSCVKGARRMLMKLTPDVDGKCDVMKCESNDENESDDSRQRFQDDFLDFDRAVFLPV